MLRDLGLSNRHGLGIENRATSVSKCMWFGTVRVHLFLSVHILYCVAPLILIFFWSRLCTNTLKEKLCHQRAALWVPLCLPRATHKSPVLCWAPVTPSHTAVTHTQAEVKAHIFMCTHTHKLLTHMHTVKSMRAHAHTHSLTHTLTHARTHTHTKSLTHKL